MRGSQLCAGMNCSAGRSAIAFVRKKRVRQPEPVRGRRSDGIRRCSSVDDRYSTAKAVSVPVFFKIGAILRQVCKLNCANSLHNVKIVCESRTNGKEKARGFDHAPLLLWNFKIKNRCFCRSMESLPADRTSRFLRLCEPYRRILRQ